eukprot:4965887-Alexandrium_andersonii.AAC.1
MVVCRLVVIARTRSSGLVCVAVAWAVGVCTIFMEGVYQVRSFGAVGSGQVACRSGAPSPFARRR